VSTSAGFLVLSVLTAQTPCVHCPTSAIVRIDRSPPTLNFAFAWEGRDPGFTPGTAVEFQVVIDNPPEEKCFFQPPGGRDTNPNLARLTGFPGTLEAYTDVWNFWWPTTDPQVRAGIVGSHCFDPVWPGLQQLYEDQYVRLALAMNGADPVMNLAIGVRRADLLVRDHWYVVSYPVELPQDVRCAIPAAGWGKARIEMQQMPNTCTPIYPGTPPLTSPWAFTCPHVLGGVGVCAEYNQPGHPEGIEQWITRLCAPTDTIAIRPGLYEPDTQPTAQCVDFDGDSYFSTQCQEVFGTRTGDCLDQSVASSPVSGALCVNSAANAAMTGLGASCPLLPQPQPGTPAQGATILAPAIVTFTWSTVPL
jgi:hypothetical protein